MNNEGEFQNCKIVTKYTIDSNVESRLDVNIFDVHKPTKFTKLDIDSLAKLEIDEIMDDDSDILNLKNNFFPKGLVPLQDLFDSDIP